MHKYCLSKELEKILQKLSKKDNVLYRQVINKIDEIINSDVDSYKNLRYNMKDYRRVHIGGSFVLIFRYERDQDLILFVDFDHHDKIYK